MKWYICAGTILLMASCKKPDNNPPATLNSGILTNHQWYYYSERTVTHIDSINVLVSDTTVYNSNLICPVPNYIILNPDSSASLIQNCGTLNLLPGGYWKLSSDSTFFINIPFSRISYGTGYIIGNAGLQPGKLLSLTDNSFTTRLTEFWTACSPCVKYRKERYITFKAK